MGHRQGKLIYLSLLESRLCVLWNYLWILNKKSPPPPPPRKSVWLGSTLGGHVLSGVPVDLVFLSDRLPKLQPGVPWRQTTCLPPLKFLLFDRKCSPVISCLRHCPTAFVKVGLAAMCGWSQTHLCGFPAEPRRISLEGYLSHQVNPCGCPFLWRHRLI